MEISKQGFGHSEAGGFRRICFSFFDPIFSGRCFAFYGQFGFSTQCVGVVRLIFESHRNDLTWVFGKPFCVGLFLRTRFLTIVYFFFVKVQKRMWNSDVVFRLWFSGNFLNWAGDSWGIPNELRPIIGQANGGSMIQKWLELSVNNNRTMVL